jgi:uncharacterized protein (DUF849 family)
MNNMEKLVLTVATTGAWPTKENTPYIPLTPEEIADEVHKCYQAGASVAHIHVRDKDGKPSMNAERFRQTVGLIRERCDIVINLTTSGDLDATDEDRMQHFMELKPELASFDAGTMNWGHSTIFQNHPLFLEKLGKRMKEYGVKPEIEVFDTGMFYNAQHYIKQGILDEPVHYQFVLGAPGGMAATVDNLLYLKNLLPESATWSAFGIGKMHLSIQYATLALGGHTRVGMEDNIYYSRGVLAKSNVEFVERTVRLANELGREIASPNEARNLLKLG